MYPILLWLDGFLPLKRDKANVNCKLLKVMSDWFHGQFTITFFYLLHFVENMFDREKIAWDLQI